MRLKVLAVKLQDLVRMRGRRRQCGGPPGVLVVYLVRHSTHGQRGH